MNRRDVIVGALILILVAAAVVWFVRNRSLSRSLPLATPSITPVSPLETTLKRRFNIDFPDNQEKVELKDVSGGNASGLVTRNFEDGQYTLIVIADLPDLDAGYFYEAWVNRGDSRVAVGKLTVAKGGWLLDYTSPTNYMDYKKVVISREKVDDAKLETPVLEASF